MVTKLVFKLLFKAMVPLVCMVGVMSYGMYTMGGDPAALFKKVVGGSFESAKASVQNAGSSIKDLPDTVQALPSKASDVVSGKAGKTKIFKWVDENGVTQFGTRAPDGVIASSKTYDSNANLMAAPKKPEPSFEAAEGQLPPGFGPDGERLPGMAGMNLPVNVDPAVMAQFLQTMQQRQP